MKNYQLQPNEVVRFQAPITLQTEKGDIPAELILTDLNFIFVTERKKFLWFKRKNRVVAYAKELVQIFNDAPEIKQEATKVKICFSTEDKIFSFTDKETARDFVINAWEIITGKTRLARIVNKLKNALDLIHENIDIMAIVNVVLAAKGIQGGLKGLPGKLLSLLPIKK